MNSSPSDSARPLVLDGLKDFSAPFPAVICDLWGVLHNGVAAFEPAVDCLRRMRARGQAVALLTNAPRPHAVIIPQLDSLGVSRDCRDAIVTSGDLTRAYLLAEGPKGPLFHLGPPRDQALADCIPNEITRDMNRAEAILCSGLLEDHEDDLAYHDQILKEALTGNLTLVCANPDRVVKIGDRLTCCAGALAERYEQLGGAVVRFGKPDPSAYGHALKCLQEKTGKEFTAGETLVIGDSLATDIKGAALSGMTSAFVNSGIHQDELAGRDAFQQKNWFQENAETIPDAVISHLKW